MSFNIVHGQDFSDWIFEKMTFSDKKLNKPEWYRTIGVLEGEEIVGAVILFDYDGVNIFLGGAGLSTKNWLNKRLIVETSDFVFNVLRCESVIARTQPENTKAKRILEGLGFTQQGIIVKGYGTQDMIFYRLLKTKAEKWLRTKEIQYA
jgi:RimJ/RimL family protein N-acetyltransferase